MIFERPCSKFEFPVVDGATDYQRRPGGPSRYICVCRVINVRADRRERAERARGRRTGPTDNLLRSERGETAGDHLPDHVCPDSLRFVSDHTSGSSPETDKDSPGGQKLI